MTQQETAISAHQGKDQLVMTWVTRITFFIISVTFFTVIWPVLALSLPIWLTVLGIWAVPFTVAVLIHQHTEGKEHNPT